MTADLHRDSSSRPRGVLDTVPPESMFIDGRWARAHTGRTFEVFNPATEQRLAVVADADVHDGLRALDAAVRAQEAWTATSAQRRADLLAATFVAIHDHADEIAHLIVAEMGKPLAEARGEVTYGAGFFRWFAESASRLHLDGQFGLEPGGQYRIAVSKRPVGPSLLITPWNFPLAMATRKMAAALAAGCTVVLKPAEQTPLTSLLLAELTRQVGIPAGVVNVVTTTHAPDVIAALMKDPRARKVSFTGSTTVGKTLLRQAADNVMNTSMELGGNGPLIVFDDADLDQAVDGAMVAKLRNGGESCVAANRIFVHRSIADAFAQRLTTRMAAVRVGNGADGATELGPLIDSRQRDKVESLVNDAVGKGAHCATGGHRLPGPGYFYEPTVLRSVPASALLCDEEVFGPVAALFEFDDEAEVIARANDTPYGLASYVFTRDLARALRVSDALDTGMTGVNRGVVSNPAAPFGGTKQSGLGREGGVEGLEAYLETKYVGIEL